MAFARINGTLLHFRTSGAQGAPALVFINSLGTDARIWDEVIAEFAETHFCLSYDKRGHGLSDTPRGDYRLDDHLDDLLGLTDHVGISSAVVVGVSIGGMIAQGLAKKRARDIGHLPQSGAGGMLEWLDRLPSGTRKILIHVNNTNPILDEDSAERAELRRRGVEVAWDGMEIVP